VPVSIIEASRKRLSQFVGGAVENVKALKQSVRGIKAKQGESSFQFYRTISILSFFFFFLIFISRVIVT